MTFEEFIDILLKLVFELLVEDCCLIPLKVQNLMLWRRNTRVLCVHPQGWWDSTLPYKYFWVSSLCGKEAHAFLIQCIFLLYFQIRSFDSRDGQSVILMFCCLDNQDMLWTPGMFISYFLFRVLERGLQSWEAL